MDGHRNTRFQRGSTGVHTQRPLWPDSQTIVFVPPIEMMVGKQIDAHAQLFHLSKLCGVSQLTVLKRKPMIGAWHISQSGCEGFKDHICCLVPIGVRVDLNACRQCQTV